MNIRWLSLFAVLSLIGGCHFAQLSDPNEIVGAQTIDAEVVQRNIAQSYDVLSKRVQKNEITEEEMKSMIGKTVKQITDQVEVSSIPDAGAWRFADLFRQAGDLKTARALYERAIKVARDEDRRVNDSLQLARVIALEGDIDGAIKVAETTFSAPPKEKAPIMMSALYEIFPAGKGKGKDVELALFLERAIDQHMLVQVDSSSSAGKTFLEVMPIHIGKAWDLVLGTFAREQRTDLFDAAIKHRERLDSQSGKV